MELETPKPKLLHTILLALPMFILTLAPASMGFSPDPLQLIPLAITYLIFNGVFFLILYTGKTDSYRAFLFTLTAVTFPISFILGLYEERGHFMVLTFEDLLGGNTPFCHLGVPQTLLAILTKKVIIFPGTAQTVAMMFFMWIGISLALGRGWCSWGCFWGGWEEGFSRLKKKPWITKFHPYLRYIPFAVLLATVLVSTMTLSPQYCWWICPFKAVSEFLEIANAKIIIQTVIFVTIFLGLVIILPLLSKKRTQCSFLCPFGAMQSLINPITPFSIAIDREKCSGCKRCIKVCPVFSMDETSLQKGKPEVTCIKCGKCIDNCPKGAVSYQIKGTRLGLHTQAKRLLFLYPAFLVLTFIGGQYLSGALYRIMLFITTGSFIK
jgi:ferredoxin-type protein NapH